MRRPLSVVAPPRGASPSPSPAMAARGALRCGLALRGSPRAARRVGSAAPPRSLALLSACGKGLARFAAPLAPLPAAPWLAGGGAPPRLRSPSAPPLGGALAPPFGRGSGGAFRAPPRSVPRLRARCGGMCCAVGCTPPRKKSPRSCAPRRAGVAASAAPPIGGW